MKLNDYWGIFDIDGNLVPLPIQPIYCPVCGSELILHDFRVYKHSNGLCHVDVHVKCPKCGSWWYVDLKQQQIRSPSVFGLPIPCELADKLLKSKYHGKVLRMELKEIYPELDKSVEERLRRWGYW